LIIYQKGKFLSFSTFPDNGKGEKPDESGEGEGQPEKHKSCLIFFRIVQLVNGKPDHLRIISV